LKADNHVKQARLSVFYEKLKKQAPLDYTLNN